MKQFAIMLLIAIPILCLAFGKEKICWKTIRNSGSENKSPIKMVHEDNLEIGKAISADSVKVSHSGGRAENYIPPGRLGVGYTFDKFVVQGEAGREGGDGSFYGEPDRPPGKPRRPTIVSAN